MRKEPPIFKAILLSLMISTFILYVYMHEQTHIKIYDNFGINETTYNITLEKFYLYPNQTQLEALDVQSYRELRFLQSQAEMLGYHLISLMFLLVVLALYIKR